MELHQFFGDVNFSGARFHVVYFYDTDFQKTVSFYQTAFGEANFSGTKFRDKNFPGTFALPSRYYYYGSCTLSSDYRPQWKNVYFLQISFSSLLERANQPQ